MFKHILVPVDGSLTAQKGVERATEMARAFGSALTLVYVTDPYPFAGLGSDFAAGQAQYLSAANAEAEQAMDMARKACAAAGISASARVIEAQGGAWQGILNAAEQAQADLIVMGSHGRHGLEKMVLGSETQRVLAHTRLPVLVVRD